MLTGTGYSLIVLDADRSAGRHFRRYNLGR
jgi:hypothetical protein